jgi:demethylmenaquinone methyltransferase / 2-methoxy-6-polyprenyl-1,4-benzoquinol methylase
MANQFYAAGEARAARVQALFDTIAHRYDLINDLQSFGLHRYWKQRLITMTRLRAGEMALDVCCGTGDISLQLARSGARVVGLDFSAAMTRYASQRASSLKIPFIRGDALRIPFQDQQFHLVTIGYGLRNLADFQSGLKEMIRVLQPSGRLVVLDFGKPNNAVWRALYFLYLKMCVPLLGKFLCGNREAYAYILESLVHFPGQTGVESMLRSMQLENVRTVHLFGGVMGLNYAEKPAV